MPTRRGLLATLPAACLAAPPEALLEPVTRLLLPAEGPRPVALTLDACGGGTDHRILEVLLRLRVAATIFATARWLRGNPETVALLLAHPGQFGVQNHGARHLPPIFGTGRIYGLAVAGTAEVLRQEIAGGAAAIAAAGFPPPRWYRGATALYSPAALGLVEAMGFAVAGFSLNGDEGASLPAPLAARRVASARGGDVVIAHLNQPGHAAGAGVAAGIEALHGVGVEFVRLEDWPVTPPECRRHALPRAAPSGPGAPPAREGGDGLP
ncbi:polysaccharide deacetylase family protein [Roseicella aquatilis]|nr:polysaccharide deacetylase family protein [Roseicella aquatilis]